MLVGPWYIKLSHDVQMRELDMTTGEETTKTQGKITLESVIKNVTSSFVKSDIPDFKPGDVVRVHAKIIEGTKERIQVFEGLVLKRSKKNSIDATFTVRKVSYNIGVERTFPLHSPRVEKVEVVTRAKVRRARLFYIRPLRGKATRMKTLFNAPAKAAGNDTQAA
jgi:large subunit ribosomal protein L19